MGEHTKLTLVAPDAAPENDKDYCQQCGTPWPCEIADLTYRLEVAEQQYVEMAALSLKYETRAARLAAALREMASLLETPSVLYEGELGGVWIGCRVCRRACVRRTDGVDTPLYKPGYGHADGCPVPSLLERIATDAAAQPEKARTAAELLERLPVINDPAISAMVADAPWDERPEAPDAERARLERAVIEAARAYTRLRLAESLAIARRDDRVSYRLVAEARETRGAIMRSVGALDAHQQAAAGGTETEGM